MVVFRSIVIAVKAIRMRLLSVGAAYGLQSTARIITGAALIMVAVFAGFAAGRLVMLQQVEFGLRFKPRVPWPSKFHPGLSTTNGNSGV